MILLLFLMNRKPIGFWVIWYLTPSLVRCFIKIVNFSLILIFLGGIDIVLGISYVEVVHWPVLHEDEGRWLTWGVTDFAESFSMCP